MFPAPCTNDCDFLVTYNVTSSNKVEFELSGKGDWVAVGFSDDQFMVIIYYISLYFNVVLVGGLSEIIIHQIFSLARDWSKRVTWANITQLKLGNILRYSPIFKTACVA